MSDEQLREDELVSAYLDGEATPAEIAEVEQDDALMARVEQLRAVRDAVAEPVAPMPAELRDQMIGTALAVSDADSAQRRDARIVPIHRRRETLLAVAAAVMLLAAVVSAGLIASRGGDDAETAADASAMAQAGTAAAEMAAPAEEAPMAEEAAPAASTTAAYVETAEEEPMAELEAAMAEEEPMAELEAAMAEAADAPDEAALTAAEAESAMEAPAADAPTLSTDEEDAGRRTDDDAAVPVVDLGTFENLDSLFGDIAARWSAALEDGAVADSGMCSAAVRNKASDLDVETGQPFIAAVGTEDPLIFDGRFARRADGTAVIIHAAPPSCETGTHELDESDGS